MPYSVAAKNAMLDYLGTLIDRLSVHSTNPGSTGSGEIPGSIRQPVTWNAASSGSKTQSNTPSFTGLSTSYAVNYVGMWNSGTGTYYGYQQVTATSASGGGTWAYDTAAGSLDLNATASA